MPVVQPSSRTEPGDDVLDVLAKLVAYPTESRTPNVDLIDFCAERGSTAGGVATVLPGDDGRANLLVRFGPDAPGGVLLSGHSDVVPAGAGWSTDPYSLTEVGGELHGRGVADMKGFIAVALSVLADAPALQRPVYLALSYDEEIGCVGVRPMLDALPDSVAPELVVIGEPTGMRLCNAHTGKAAFAVELRGSPMHSCRAPSQPSAVVAAADLVSTIDGVQRHDTSATTHTNDHHHISTNVGTIHGGVALNIMAPDVHLTFEVRHSADIDVDTLLAPLWAETGRLDERLATVDGGVEVTALSAYPALHTDPHTAAVERFGAIVDSGPIGAIEFGCEGGLYADRLGAPVVVCGPGHITDAHRPDEHVSPDQLAWCRRTVEGLIDAHSRKEQP